MTAVTVLLSAASDDVQQVKILGVVRIVRAGLFGVLKGCYPVPQMIVCIGTVIVPFRRLYFYCTQNMKSFPVGAILKIGSDAVQIGVLASGLLIALIKAREVVIGKRSVAVSSRVGI